MIKIMNLRELDARESILPFSANILFLFKINSLTIDMTSTADIRHRD